MCARQNPHVSGVLQDTIASLEMSAYPTTPDGRYFVVRGRLWRCSNPALSPEEKLHWVGALMKARRAKGKAMRSEDREEQEKARQQVDEAKVVLGERGTPWWTDGAPDWNRTMVKNTPYAAWFNALGARWERE